MANFIEKRWEILHILLVKTQQGKINWDTAPSPDMIYANIGGLGVSLQPSGPDFIISFHDENGDVTETLSDVNFSSEGFENAYPIMKNLHELALAEATGSEKVIDALLASLKNE